MADGGDVGRGGGVLVLYGGGVIGGGGGILVLYGGGVVGGGRWRQVETLTSLFSADGAGPHRTSHTQILWGCCLAASDMKRL